MKWFSFVLTGAYALCTLSSQAQARPQEPNIKISVTAERSDEPNVDQANEQDAKKESKKGEKNSLKLQLRKQLSVAQDEAKTDDTSEDVTLSFTVDAPPKIWLGIGLKEVEGDLATYLDSTAGVFVEEVFPDSPAAAAKLQKGDIVIAINGEKLDGPMDLVSALRKIGEQADSQKPDSDSDDSDSEDKKSKEEDDKESTSESKYPTVTLTIKRHEKEVEIELTPGSRPQSLSVTAQPVGQLKDGASFFYFGEPNVNTINKSVIVMKDENGDVQVQIDRTGEGEAQIVITDDKGQRTIDQSQLKELPEKLRSAVERALKHQHKPGLHVEQGHAGDQADLNEKVLKDVNEQVEKAIKRLGNAGVQIDVSALPEQLKKLGEMNGVIVIRPEMGEMAMKWAEVGAGKAHAFSGIPEEIKLLREQVDQLKKQVEELKAELKASNQ